MVGSRPASNSSERAFLSKDLSVEPQLQLAEPRGLRQRFSVRGGAEITVFSTNSIRTAAWFTDH
jgi:hypothetical protein